jgi:hypothetical protein
MQTNTDSQRENSMTKRLIEAAKSVVAFFGYDDYWCVAKLGVAIAEAERKAADDALPIDEEWMVSEFKDIANEDNRHLIRVVDLTNDGEIDIGIGSKGCCLTAFFPYREDGHAVFPHIKNRGQLRKLIAALKGGE